MTIPFNPHWYDIPGPATEDPPLWGKERELWLEFADGFVYTGGSFLEMIEPYLFTVVRDPEKREEWRQFVKGMGVIHSTYLNLTAFVRKVAFNTPIGRQQEVTGVEGATKEWYESLTGLRIPVLFDTVGLWALPTPDALAAKFGWMAYILAKIPAGYPDWGWSYFTLDEVLTSSSWGRWKAIYWWLDQYKEDTGREPFIQTSRMICRWPDPHVAVAAGKRWYIGTMWDPTAPDPISVLTEDYDWPLWYYEF